MDRMLIGPKREGVEPIELRVNGKDYVTYTDKTLLRFLRDDLKITSVKDGCSQGACGTCTVLVGDQRKASCTVKLSKVASEVLTVDGLSQREKDAFVYAFGEAGAVQCGFCTPGMVMSGAAVLRANPDPSEEEIKEGIKSNICRCTGYVKIIKGIKMAADILNGKCQLENTDDNNRVGSRLLRLDSDDKVLGQGEFCDDMDMEGLTYGSAIRSKYPRARILSLDISKAAALDGVVGVLTAKDVPNNKVGHIQQDWDVFIEEGQITRSEGDAICLVVAKTPEILEAAKKLVEIDYEELETVSSIEEARQPDAPKVHPNGNLCQQRHVSRGNAEEAFKKCKYVVENHYKTPFTEHAFLEPECALAHPYKEGVKIYTSDQSVYDTQKETLIMFGWQEHPERVVVENKLVGGGFGGKEDVSVQHLAALAAYKFQVPVKIKLTRDESLKFHPKRHAMEGRFKLGCDEEGNFLAMECEINFDTGAYASLCGPVLERACTHSVGPYHYENTDIRGFGYYTNNPPAGAFRGFGVCQSNFAIESNINLLAEKVGISPWEIRYKNAIRPGEVLPNGQIADSSTALIETLDAIKDVYEQNKGHVGIACAMKNVGVGVGLPDKGRARVVVDGDSIHIFCAASGMGQGVRTVLSQIAGETLGLDQHHVIVEMPNTETSPDSGTSSGSRQTLISGEAVRKACELLKDALQDQTMEALDGQEFFYEYFDPTDPLTSTKPNPVSHITYGFATHVVVLDDDGLITDVYAAHDSGQIVNPTMIEGQVEGGVVMGLGYALTEDFKLDRSKVKAKFANLGLFKANQVPCIHSIFVKRNELLDLAYGAKGIGEISTIPIAAAVQGAYYALDGVLRTEFPMKDTAYSKPKKVFNHEVK
ncbi:selenium-dependent xanthine dehydrogenase [Peptoniphilus equinus]|uniref:Selenium-dependent xanthine dehydrogenase n=1 Tax=Peptoniphilus equinus TaxID=3016343 RepID=A0ABY7QUX8_9FIRM|nr:selenium-dependent xanthine dehydrogenase [Peptoniphilus equinus]WBW50582.1 selenium-dependent xanthine dehydrogenase [Peptoniphilus equinus]